MATLWTRMDTVISQNERLVFLEGVWLSVFLSKSEIFIVTIPKGVISFD